MALALADHAVAHIARRVERDRGAMPLAEAMSRRLGVESWMLRVDDTGRLRSIVVLGPGIAAVPDDPVPAPVPAPPADPLERLHPLPPGSALARLLGSSTATGRQLADLALRSGDAEIRGEAVGVAVDAVIRDPVLEQSVLAALGGLDDAALAQSLTGIAGDAAPGLLSVVVERARGHPLGQRAARVYERLGGG